MIRQLLAKGMKVFWLLPGFLLWAAYPPMGEMMDCLFALAPLLWLSRNGDTKTAVRRWFVNGFLFWFATLSWMPAIVKNGGPWPLVVLGWGALSAYCAAYFAAFGYLSSKVWSFVRGRRYWWRLAAIIVAEPLLWAGLEIIRSRLFGGFAWNQLGVVPAVGGFGAPAALGGVYLLSVVVVLINGTVASIAERILAPLLAARRRRTLHLKGGDVNIQEDETPSRLDPPRWTRSIETLLPFALIWGLYSISVKYGTQPVADGMEGAKVLRVAMVQRNYPCVFMRDRSESPVEVYRNLLGNVSPLQPELVVLAESAFSEIGLFGSANAVLFADWIREQSGANGVLAGGVRIADGKEYNSAALFGDGTVEVYDKVHLVPFGEFIPFDKTITALQRLAPVGSCTPGELKTLDFGGMKLGVAICFEDTDSAQVRRLASMGAQALVFITNDSWFSHSSEAVQHAWQSVARSVETGLPVIRVGNSGVTGTIAPLGGFGGTSWLIGSNGKPLVDVRGTMFDRVAIPPTDESTGHTVLTPYVIAGDAPLFMAFLALVASMLYFEVRRRVSAANGEIAVHG